MRNFIRRSTMFMALFVCMNLLANIASGQTVTTDKPDYSPGEYVIITGGGWIAGESVSINILSDCGCTDTTFTVQASTGGEIYHDQFLILPEHLGAAFILTATGAQGSAITTFTDGNLRVRTISNVNNSTTNLTFINYSGSPTCSGTGVSGSITATGNYNAGSIGAALSTQSFSITAPLYNNSNPAEIFRFWNVSGPSGDLKGSKNLTICVQGRDNNGNISITAFYGPCGNGSGASFTGTPSGTPSTICAGSTADLTAVTGNGNFVFWYDAPTGGNEIGSSESGGIVTTPVLTATTDFYAEAVTGDGCVNPIRVKVTVTVVPQPVGPVIAKVPNTASACTGATLTISVATAGTGGVAGSQDQYRYSTDNGDNWSAWSTSLPSFAAGTGTNIVESRRFSSTGGCSTAGNTVSWTVSPSASITSVTGTTPLCIGQTTSYTANGVVLGNGTGAWSSSNEAVATVDANGLVSAVGAGTCDIVYTITGACGGTKSAQQSLTIKANVGITSVTAGANPICSNATTTLTANGVAGTGAVVTWYSQTGGAGTNYGTGLTLPNVGPGTYYARVTGDCGTAQEQSITINAKINVGITSVTAGANPICSNATTTLTANGVAGTGAVVTWYSQ
ncbi:MAG TPA: hypothetical protein VF476_14730, partial [Chitinophagaceae bacterium]